MRPTQPWHEHFVGRVVRFLGSLQLAVPVLVAVAAALAWGTYLESTQGVKVARSVVYGSWWFLGVMCLVCVSLIFAVVVRYPWKRRHIGFMIVHASLITLIVGGFWSMFTRVEGHMALEEGMTGDAVELDQEVFEVARVNAGVFTTLGDAPAPEKRGSVSVAGVRIDLVERWDNIRSEEFVDDGGPEPFRAVEVTTVEGAPAGDWVGEESKVAGMNMIQGLRVRVLPDGATWEPEEKKAAEAPEFYFEVGDKKYPLKAEGEEAFPGWKVVKVERFTRALVDAGKISESQGGQENPAVDVTITDGKGTTERHTAFLNFPAMVLSKAIEGTAKSGARLTSAAQGESLIVYGPVGAPKYGYVDVHGVGRRLEATGSLPATFEVGGRHVTILRHVARARTGRRWVKAPPATEHRPAWVVRLNGAEQTVVVPWKGPVPVPGGAGNLVLRYGPRMVPLPFNVTLKDFRKLDYPGTEMAMAYESDVVVSRPGHPDLQRRIWMNNPYAQGAWKVYQSGFMGDNVSVFSVMKDSGLPVTYAGAIGLCVGILITFYSRSLSWGHPGIPIEFSKKEPDHGAPVVPPAPRDVSVPEPASAGV